MKLRFVVREGQNIRSKVIAFHSCECLNRIVDENLDGWREWETYKWKSRGCMDKSAVDYCRLRDTHTCLNQGIYSLSELMLAYCRRRWSNIKSTLVQFLVFAENGCTHSVTHSCWASVVDGCPTASQHWANVPNRVRRLVNGGNNHMLLLRVDPTLTLQRKRLNWRESTKWKDTGYKLQPLVILNPICSEIFTFLT